jgi:hypothetical protein
MSASAVPRRRPRIARARIRSADALKHAACEFACAIVRHNAYRTCRRTERKRRTDALSIPFEGPIKEAAKLPSRQKKRSAKRKGPTVQASERSLALLTAYDEAYALAQLCKRLLWYDFRRLSANASEHEDMDGATHKLRRALADAWIDPR